MLDELISKRMAIEALGDEPYADSESDDYDWGTHNQWVYDMECIKGLPSAQPEIIRCRDCKHRPTREENGWLDFPTERCPCQNADDFYYSWMPDDDWFCGNAERREE